MLEYPVLQPHVFDFDITPLALLQHSVWRVLVRSDGPAQSLHCSCSYSHSRAFRSPAMACIPMKRTVSVNFPEGTTPWNINHIDVIDGKEFVAVKSVDTGCCRFMTGNKYTIPPSVMSRMKLLRTNATMGDTGDTELVEGIAHTKYTASKLKKRRILNQGVPDTVTIEMPAVEHNGIRMDAMSVMCVASTGTREVLKVELDITVLSFLRLTCMAAASAEESMGGDACDSRKVQNLYWRDDRSAWILKHGGSYKTFSVAKYGSKEEAHAAAVEWQSRPASADEILQEAEHP